jgi:hypothetical protein
LVPYTRAYLSRTILPVVGSEVLIVVTMKSTLFCDVVLYKFADVSEESLPPASGSKEESIQKQAANRALVFHPEDGRATELKGITFQTIALFSFAFSSIYT